MQVWRCRASGRDEGGQAVDVVVKLLHESLFPLPTGGGSNESDRWSWWSAEWLRKREVGKARESKRQVAIGARRKGEADVLSRSPHQSYALLNDFQGSDTPICYRFYHFDLPHGERIVGIVLEDLSAIARTLGEFLFQERTTKNDELELADGVDNVVSVDLHSSGIEKANATADSHSPRRLQFTPALQAVRRFQDRGIVYLHPQPTDIFVLESQAMTDGPLALVFLDLAHTSTCAKAEQSIRQWERTRPVLPVGAVPSMPQHWRHNDES